MRRCRRQWLSPWTALVSLRKPRFVAGETALACRRCRSYGDEFQGRIPATPRCKRGGDCPPECCGLTAYGTTRLKTIHTRLPKGHDHCRLGDNEWAVFSGLSPSRLRILPSITGRYAYAACGGSRDRRTSEPGSVNNGGRSCPNRATENRPANWKVVSHFVNMEQLLLLGTYPSCVHM